MRTAKTLLLLLLAACSATTLWGCRGMVRDSFRPPKARFVDVEPAGDPREALRGGPVRLRLVFQVTNPNGYALSLSRIAYSGHLGTIRIAEGEHSEEVTLEAGKTTLVRAPVDIIPSALREALLNALMRRSVDYEFNGSLGVRTPLVGVVQVPFSVSGHVEMAEMMRRLGVPLD